MFEYDLLLILSILALFILILSSDLIVIYLAIELQALASYGLIAIHNDSEFSLEASVKYFVLSPISLFV
jgi:NADH-quinone oxidoreductase subunit N